MKKLIYKTIVFLTVACGTISCSGFWDIQPLTQVPAATYFQNDATIQSGLAACYAGLYMVSGNGSKELNLFPGVTDDGYTTDSSWLMFLQNSLNNNMTGDLNTMYSNAYEAIYKTNNFIEMVSPTNVIDATKKAQYIAEAKVLRAYFYFFVTNIFGDAVLTLTPESRREEILKFVRISRIVIKDSMVNDLMNAVKILPKTSYNAGHIVSGTAAALAMRFKMMDYGTPDYAGIVKVFEDNFKVTGDPNFALVKKRQFKSMFDGNSVKSNAESDLLTASDNKEVMLSIRYSTSATLSFPYMGGLVSTTICARPNLFNFYQFDDGTPYETSGANPKYNPADPFKNRDARLMYTITNKNSLDTMASYPVKDFLKTNPTYYAWKKYTPYYILYDRPLNVGEILTQDVIVLRYPEVLLMYAEALNETGRQADAVTALNVVRTRFLPASTAKTKAEVAAAIQYERRAEFAQEGGVRYYDLQRWNTMKDILPTLPVSVLNQSTKCVFIARQRYWPIPEFERIANPNITQNPGY